MSHHSGLVSGISWKDQMIFSMQLATIPKSATPTHLLPICTSLFCLLTLFALFSPLWSICVCCVVWIRVHTTPHFAHFIFWLLTFDVVFDFPFFVTIPVDFGPN